MSGKLVGFFFKPRVLEGNHLRLLVALPLSSLCGSQSSSCLLLSWNVGHSPGPSFSSSLPLQPSRLPYSLFCFLSLLFTFSVLRVSLQGSEDRSVFCSQMFQCSFFSPWKMHFPVWGDFWVLCLLLLLLYQQLHCHTGIVNTELALAWSSMSASYLLVFSQQFNAWLGARNP